MRQKGPIGESSLTQQFRQLGDIGRDPSRLVFGKELGGGSSPRLILVIDVGEVAPML